MSNIREKRIVSEELLELAAGIERKVAEIYQLLYLKFKENGMAASLWFSLSAEEEGHAAYLEMEIRILRNSPEAFGEARVDMEPLRSTMNELEEIERFIRENPVTLEKAICISFQIEQEMVEKKYTELIDIASPSLKKILESLMRKSDHTERIGIAAAKLGIKCR